MNPQLSELHLATINCLSPKHGHCGALHRSCLGLVIFGWLLAFTNIAQDPIPFNTQTCVSSQAVTQAFSDAKSFVSSSYPCSLGLLLFLPSAPHLRLAVARVLVTKAL